MTSSETWWRIWDGVRAKNARVVESARVERISGVSNLPERFEPGVDYFAAHVNQLYLAKSRKWFETYDPMVLVVSEHVYDGASVVVPFVVGPSLISKYFKSLPHGMVFTDTRVAGIHPYTGGMFALSLVLARARRESYVRKMLEFVESTSSAFLKIAGGAGQIIDLSSHLKIASTILDAVEGLFGLGDTLPVIGHRFAYDDQFTPWLKPGFFALVDADVNQVPEQQFNIVDGRLYVEGDEGSERYRDTDFILYSLRPIPTRTDYEELPFHKRYKEALRAATAIGEESWERSKALLVALYQDLFTSPDLTWTQAKELAELYKGRIIDAHNRVQTFSTLDGGRYKTTSEQVIASGTVDGVVKDPFSKERAEAVLGSAHLLKLP